MDTVFEGTEKKCEVILHHGAVDLRTLNRDFWTEMVDACGATILSSIHNEVCDAYLLSESSLFVWNDHFLLITCGQTKLVDSILYFLERFDVQQVAQMLFQRKNELHSELQHSNFAQDVSRLQNRVKGVQIAFGDTSSHHTELFYLEHPYSLTSKDQTYELLMYGIDEESSAYFTQTTLIANDIRQKLRLQDYLAGWEIDDFVFEPCGYSLNAIKGDRYCTIHLTPQQGYSYVSVETNGCLDALIAVLLAVFNPETFDVVLYLHNQPIDLASENIGSRYTMDQQQQKSLQCGYEMKFTHWKRTVDSGH